MMRVYQKDFSYFTSSNSFYLEKMIKINPPDFGYYKAKQKAREFDKQLKKEQIEKMQQFARVYEISVRQENVRSKTKELTGTYTSRFKVIPRCKSNGRLTEG